MLDKELLKNIITLFPNELIVSIYKEKKVNNFGFRAGNIDEVKKNRQILEQNLLKRQNVIFLDMHLKRIIDKSICISVEITQDNVREVLESYDLVKLMIYLLVENRKAEFEFLWENKIDLVKKEGDLVIDPKETKKIITNQESKKITKKLIGKIENLENRIKSRELQFEIKYQELNEKYEMRLRERNTLLDENGKLKIKLKDESNISKNLICEIDTMKSNRNEEIEALQNENEKINQEIIQLKEEMEKSVVNKNESYILIVGEIETLSIKKKNIDCMKFPDFSALSNDHSLKKYNEIWIINYDLTRKEKDILAFIIKDKLIIQHIVNIHHWNELKLNLLKFETEEAIL